MRVAIQKKGRKRYELIVDGNLAAAARSLNEIEQQLRIMKMVVDLPDMTGTL